VKLEKKEICLGIGLLGGLRALLPERLELFLAALGQGLPPRNLFVVLVQNLNSTHKMKINRGVSSVPCQHLELKKEEKRTESFSREMLSVSCLRLLATLSKAESFSRASTYRSKINNKKEVSEAAIPKKKKRKEKKKSDR